MQIHKDSLLENKPLICNQVKTTSEAYKLNGKRYSANSETLTVDKLLKNPSLKLAVCAIIQASMSTGCSQADGYCMEARLTEVPYEVHSCCEADTGR